MHGEPTKSVTLLGLITFRGHISQGSAPSRATLGWDLVNAFGVSVRNKNLLIRQIDNPRNFICHLITAVLGPLIFVSSIYAIGQTRYIEFAEKIDSARIVSNGKAAPIIVDAQDYPGVLRAAHNLQEDIERVSGIRPQLISDRPRQAADLIVIGTLGKSRLIDELVRLGKVDASPIRGRVYKHVAALRR